MTYEEFVNEFNEIGDNVLQKYEKLIVKDDIRSYIKSQVRSTFGFYSTSLYNLLFEDVLLPWVEDSDPNYPYIEEQLQKIHDKKFPNE